MSKIIGFSKIFLKKKSDKKQIKINNIQIVNIVEIVSIKIHKT